MKKQKTHIIELGSYYDPDWVLAFDEKYRINLEGIRSSSSEAINKLSNERIKIIEHCIIVVFQEFKIQLSVENLKRITIIYPATITGEKNYYLDYGKETEVFLFSEGWKVPEFSNDFKSVNSNHFIKTDLQFLKSFLDLSYTLQKMNSDFNKHTAIKYNEEFENQYKILIDESSNLIEESLIKRISK